MFLLTVVVLNLIRVLFKSLKPLKSLCANRVNKLSNRTNTVKLKPIKVFSSKLEEEETKDYFDYENTIEPKIRKNKIELNTASSKIKIKS